MTSAHGDSARLWSRRSCLHCLGAGALGWGFEALASEPNGPALPTRFTRPAIETDEGGLWAIMDREETRLRRSPFLVRDQALNDYLYQLVCKLGGEHCADVRVYVVRTPLFNASMAPNGMLQVWTGLLLRVENEAQLGAVLGHELAHYLERHSIERLRDVRGRAAFGQFIGLFGAIGAIAQLGMLASMFAFSREHETRADRLSMQLLQRAGYDGREAARVWDNLMAEVKAGGYEDPAKRNPMVATHPAMETRRDELTSLAGLRGGETGEQAFAQIIAGQRGGWLQDELRRGQHAETLNLCDRLLSRRPDDLQALFTRALARQQRNGPEDAAAALTDLQQLVARADAPPQAHRALGLLHRQQGQNGLAREALQRFLDLAPDAPDAALIRSHLEQLTP